MLAALAWWTTLLSKSVMVGWSPIPFIFVHIPKCAGTSIEKALIPIVSRHSDFSDFEPEEARRFWLPGSRGLQHSKLYQYQTCFPLPEFFKFAFVRNPWDRAVSQILYLQRTHGRTLFPGDDYKRHIRTYCTTRAMVAAQDLAASQLDYLRDATGRIQMDFIGRFESLASDFRALALKLGLEDVPMLPHVFSSAPRHPYQFYYDSESAEWIRERFADDIDLFGYAFQM
jgi:hypothetical protein